MTKYDNERKSTSYFRENLFILLNLLERYEAADFDTKKDIYPNLIVEYKRYKEELKREIKILIQYDTNLWISNHILPSLAVTFVFLQEIGINRINPNSIDKVVQQVRKAYLFMESYDTDLYGN